MAQEYLLWVETADAEGEFLKQINLCNSGCFWLSGAPIKTEGDFLSTFLKA